MTCIICQRIVEEHTPDQLWRCATRAEDTARSLWSVWHARWRRAWVEVRDENDVLVYRGLACEGIPWGTFADGTGKEKWHVSYPIYPVEEPT